MCGATHRVQKACWDSTWGLGWEGSKPSRLRKACAHIAQLADAALRPQEELGRVPVAGKVMAKHEAAAAGALRAE